MSSCFLLGLIINFPSPERLGEMLYETFPTREEAELERNSKSNPKAFVIWEITGDIKQ